MDSKSILEHVRFSCLTWANTKEAELVIRELYPEYAMTVRTYE